MSMTCRPAEMRDLVSWLEIVREVEDLFGPMPDFARHAERGIERGTTLVVVGADEVLGAALLSRDDRPHRITWLAVRRSARRRGVGRLLMDAILQRWPTGDIEVVSFAPATRGGEPARRYYQRFGFEDHGRTDPGPDGGPRSLFIRRQHAHPAY